MKYQMIVPSSLVTPIRPSLLVNASRFIFIFSNPFRFLKNEAVNPLLS